MAIDPKKQVPKRGVSTANLKWFDSLVRHQIYILQMSGSVRNDVIKLLNATEQDIANQVRTRLATAKGVTPRNLKRANQLIASIRAIRSGAWDKVDKLWNSTFKDFTTEEVKFLKKAVELSVPVQLDTVLPAGGVLHSLVTNKPFEGKTLKAWSQNIRNADIDRMSSQIVIGMAQGETAPTIARRIVGTARLRGRDGVTQITRRNAEAITLTATTHFSNSAREEFLMSNEEIFSEELFVATLDGQTTPRCRALDGKRFKVGEGPKPPLHFRCRSLRVAIITPEAIGDRPFKPTTEKMLVNEFAKQNNLPGLASRTQLPRGTKGAFDQFAQRRTRELVGTVPAKTTYQQWMKSQSAVFQDDVLGVTRAKLFRRGGLKLDQFVNRVGNEIPLHDLARIEARAFRAAGLDPSDF
jgi:SPP1 gp7 family putative phage head morphogenesis protein